MSEFFKALEQAERDRQLAESTERPAATTVVSESEALHDEADPPQQGKTPAADAPPAPKAAAGAPAPAITPPATERPARSGRPSFFDRAPDPASPVDRSRAARVQERLRPPLHDAAAPPPADRSRPATPAQAQAEPIAAPVAGRPEPAPVTPPAAPVASPAPPVSPPAAPVASPAAPVVPPAPIQRATAGPGKRGKLPVLIADLDPRSVAAEAYRTLRANLEFAQTERVQRSIIVTSPSMGEGKSTTAANLAVVAAQGGTRVCLVDADMRRPAMHKVFGVANQGGLTRALSQGLPLASVAVATDVPNLSLVVAGSADGLRPAQLLNVQRLKRVMHGSDTAFDLVLFDTPPVISVADAMNLAPHCDGVLLVVRPGAVTPAVLRQAARQIAQVGGKVIGVLLNHVNLRRGEAEYYRHYRAYHTATKD